MPTLTYFKNHNGAKIDLFKIDEIAFAFAEYENDEISPLHAKRGILKNEDILHYLKKNKYVVNVSEVAFATMF